MNKVTRPNNQFILALLSIILCLTILTLIRVLYSSQGSEFGHDVFYHIRISDMFPEFIFMKSFHWTRLSVWFSHYYDKELGFHIIIAMIRQIQNLFNLSLNPPFNFISAFFALSIFSVYTFGCFLSKIKYSYLIPFLFLSLSPSFLFRILIIRPHLLSIVLFGLCIFLLFSKIKAKNKAIMVFILGIIYSYSYSSPHLLLLPVIAYCAAKIISKKHSSISELILLPTVSILGIATGLLVHPQFPNTYYNWYIQGIVVIKRMLADSNALRVGGEIYGTNITGAIINSGIYVITLVNLFLFLKVIKSVKNNKLNYDIVPIVTLFILSFTTILGYSISKRFIEYNIPINSLFLIYLLNAYFETCKINHTRPLFFTKKRKIFTYVTVLLLFGAAVSYNTKILNLKSCTLRPFTDFSKWAKKNIRPGSYIAQANWSTFPMLFYAAPEYDYSTALDPMFSYSVFPKRSLAIYKFKSLQKGYTRKELIQMFGSGLLFVSQPDYPIALELKKQGINFIYQGKDGWLFLL